jgi:hypothetical protein
MVLDFYPGLVEIMQLLDGQGPRMGRKEERADPPTHRQLLHRIPPGRFLRKDRQPVLDGIAEGDSLAKGRRRVGLPVVLVPGLLQLIEHCVQQHEPVRASRVDLARVDEQHDGMAKPAGHPAEIG